MSSRSAEATIKGYYYQFDTTILKLLQLSKDTDTVVIEGIEDIDIKTVTGNTAVQCKYLSKPTFTNSIVREPITLMLEHFINPATSSVLKYVLYAHFENETGGNEPAIDLKRLKEILTYTEKKVKHNYQSDNAISDATLGSFIAQFKLVFGTEFTTQQKQVIELLRSTFKCGSDFEADAHFYNNALRIVLDIAIKKDVKQRTISKSSFLKALDSREKLFNEWYILLRSKKEYLKTVEQNLKNNKALDPSKTKTIVLSKSIVEVKHAELPLCSFIENVIAKYYKLNSALSSAKPLTIVLDLAPEAITSLKKELIRCDIDFNDGCESIQFSCQTFNKEPVVNTSKGGKITRASYLIRIISKEIYLKHSDTIKAPKVLINFSKESLSVPSTSQYFDIKYCDNLADVYQLL